MGISDRKEREKQEMRKLIINTAMEMFINEGYEKTSIRNIADKIEYSPATLYLYYKDKDELFYEIQCEAFDRLYTYFQEGVKGDTPMQRLRSLLHVYIKFGFTNPDLYDLMFILRAPMNAVQKKDEWIKGKDAFNFLIQAVEACGDQLRFSDPLKAAVTIWGLGHGLISLQIRCRIDMLELSEPEREAFYEGIVDEFFAIIQR